MADKYGVPVQWLATSSDQQLEVWAADPNCLDRESCAKALAERIAKREAKRDWLAEGQAREASHREVESNPFDPRREVSADAKYIANKASEDADRIANKIVANLWILFVGLPIILSILWHVMNGLGSVNVSA